jgi:ABC-2 type transport system ATP-binding protein
MNLKSEHIIELENLTKSFGTIIAVNNVTLDVNKGEIFGLLGPDGAGKTTMIRMMVGILEQTSGNGTVMGFDLTHDKERIKDKIGYMSQRFSLYGDLTVAENIDYFSEIYEIPGSERKEREDRMLEFSRLTTFKDRLAQNLSGGMKQKLALACTLMHKPDVLFLDEPTTGVDPVSRREFWRILYDLVADGMTIVVSTPYMDEAERCNRVAMMNNGKILRLDTPAAFKQSITDSLVEIQADDLENVKKTLSNVEGILSIQIFGDKLHVLALKDIDATNIIIDNLKENNIEYKRIRDIQPSLEDVFVRMIENERKLEGVIHD